MKLRVDVVVQTPSTPIRRYSPACTSPAKANVHGWSESAMIGVAARPLAAEGTGQYDGSGPAITRSGPRAARAPVTACPAPRPGARGARRKRRRKMRTIAGAKAAWRTGDLRYGGPGSFSFGPTNKGRDHATGRRITPTEWVPRLRRAPAGGVDGASADARRCSIATGRRRSLAGGGPLPAHTTA